MNAAAVFTLVTNVIALIRWFIEWAQKRQWIAEGEALAMQAGLDHADASIELARTVRAKQRADIAADPAIIMQHDKHERSD